ncbi:MAG: hypothetical protein ACLPPF_18270 [Rhodomicrobium sp.]
MREEKWELPLLAVAKRQAKKAAPGGVRLFVWGFDYAIRQERMSGWIIPIQSQGGKREVSWLPLALPAGIALMRYACLPLPLPAL